MRRCSILTGRLIVPVNANILSEAEVQYKTFNLGLLMATLEDAPSRINVIILDACRNNPFARSMRSTISGLASINAPTSTLIAYATAPGKVAADGIGNNSPYTASLLEALNVKGLKIEDVFKSTRQSVSQRSGGAQVPWESSSLIGDFYFNLPD